MFPMIMLKIHMKDGKWKIKGFMNKVQVNYVTKFQLNNEQHILRLMHQEDCTT